MLCVGVNARWYTKGRSAVINHLSRDTAHKAVVFWASPTEDNWSSFSEYLGFWSVPAPCLVAMWVLNQILMCQARKPAFVSVDPPAPSISASTCISGGIGTTGQWFSLSVLYPKHFRWKGLPEALLLYHGCCFLFHAVTDSFGVCVDWLEDLY